jgi:NADP-dependent 3-hydroxy acid dehydrogenase YdfG
MDDLGDKAVLVTGAASGIGRASSVAFAHAGASPPWSTSTRTAWPAPWT